MRQGGWSLIPVLALLLLQVSAPMWAQQSEYSAASQLVRVSPDLYVGAERLDEFYNPRSVSGELGVYVIFVYFTDVAPSVSVDEISSVLQETRRYFAEASYGQVYLNWETMSWDNPWLQLPNTMDYYGAPGAGLADARWEELIMDSLKAADPYVDYRVWNRILIVHAGGDEASTGNPYDIWSFAVWGGSWNTDDGTVTLDIAVVSESDPLGIFAHELGHTLFMWPDLYSPTNAEYVGHWGLMAKGSWNGPPSSQGASPAHPLSWCRLKAGWIGATGMVVVEQQAMATVGLSALEEPTGVKVVKVPLDSQHYYLVEARVRTGFDSYLPGEGVLILYVDETLGSGEGIVRVIDSTPGDGDVDNGQWVAGTAMRDEGNGVYIYVASKADGVYEVTVRYEPSVAVQPELRVAPVKVPAGVHVDVRGLNFSPNSQVTIYFDGQPLGEAVANTYGEFNTTVRIPPDTPPGQHTLRAVDMYGVEANATLTVSTVTVWASGIQVEPGDTLSVNVSGLGSRIPYWVKFDDLLVLITHSDMLGQLYFSLKVPATTTGAHEVRVVYPGLGEPGGAVEVAALQIVVVNGTVTGPELEERLSWFNTTLQELDARLSTIEGSVEQLNLALLKLGENVSTLMGGLEELKGRVGRLDAELAQIAKAIDDAKLRIAELNKTLGAAEASLTQQIKAAEAALQELSARAGSLQEALAAARQKIAQLEEENQQLAGRADSLEKGLRQTAVLNTALTGLAIALALAALRAARRK